jgi:hypothetical protein
VKAMLSAIVAIFCLLTLCIASQAAFFSGSPPACNATPPAQAVSAGYNTLTICNALTAIPGVMDANNTLNPWYLMYPTGSGYTMPASDISVSANGLTLATIPSQNVTGTYSIAIHGPFAPGTTFEGNTISGGFYIEVEMQLDPAYCSSGSNANQAFWLDLPQGVAGSAISTTFNEIDIAERINCTTFGTIHQWSANGSGTQSAICSNSSAQGGNNNTGFSPGSGFNKYGLLIIPSTSGGGTGTIKWYYNDILQVTVTYSSGSVPSPATTCSAGAYMPVDTQQWAIMFQPGTNSPSTFRNLHVWKAP